MVGLIWLHSIQYRSRFVDSNTQLQATRSSQWSSTLGGCPMNPGDLLGSGTISGPGTGDRGSLLEMTEGGKQDVMLYGMDVRKFLKDGDTITIRGHAGKDGERVGFGPCTGRIYSSVESKK